MNTTPNVMILTDETLTTVMVSEVFFEYSHWDRAKIEAGINLRIALTGVIGEDELNQFIKKCDAAMNEETIDPYIMSATL